MPMPLRILFSIFFPPLALIDKGWDKLAITTLLFFTTGIAGNIAAFYFVFDGAAYDRWKAQSGYFTTSDSYSHYEKQKRAPYPEYDAREFIRTQDGEVFEVVDTEDAERRRRLER